MIALVAAAHAATLSGAVTGPDGAVDGAVVVAYDARFDYVVGESDATGRFALDVAPGRYRVRVLPPGGLGEVWADGATGPCGAAAWTVGEDDVDVGRIEVLAGASISGRVVDAGGAPVAGITVRAVSTADDSVLAPREAVTDADGAYTIVGLVPEDAFRLRLVGEGVPVQWVPGVYDEDDGEAIVVDPGGAATAPEAALRPGITVSGAVSGPDGPVASGWVTVYSASRTEAAPIVDGRYVARGLPPGEVTAWATIDGLAHGYYPGIASPGPRVSVPDEGGATDVVDLALPAEAMLVGKVAPALTGGEVDIGLLALNADRTVGLGGPAAADGTFALGHLWPGAYSVYAYGSRAGGVDGVVLDGDAPRTWTLDGVGPSAPITLPIAAAGRLVGTVRDADGAPIPDVVVQLDGPVWTYAVADLDGAWRIDGLPAGDYVATAYMAPYCPEDPGVVRIWWPGVLREDDADPMPIAADVAVVGDRASRWDAVLGHDADRDGMDDAWERAHGLDPEVNDAASDLDHDGETNLAEFLAGTAPDDPPPEACGCDGAGGVGVSAAVAAIVATRRRRARYPGVERTK